jgi:hypothetical protein
MDIVPQIVRKIKQKRHNLEKISIIRRYMEEKPPSKSPKNAAFVDICAFL